MNSVTCAWILFLATVQHAIAHKSVSTTKEVPLYIRQCWLKATEPAFSACICETGVNPTVAFNSIFNTEIASSPCLKCFFKCLSVKLNFMEATTGEFIEKECLRQMEGCTSEIFKTCNGKVKNEVDLCKKSFDMYMCIVHSLLKPKSSPAPAANLNAPSKVPPVSLSSTSTT